MPNEPRSPARLDRRTFLTGAAAAALAACSSTEDDAQTTTTTAADRTATTPTTAPTGAAADGSSGTDDETVTVEPLTADLFTALPVCALTPRAAEGPFPTPEPLNRRDLTEGYPGHPLRLGIRVVDDACRPVPGAQVEIWHTDATGDYSSYDDGGSGKDEGPGSTFLRGVQVADEDGILEFLTLYPGWYEGRAVHIHVKAWVDGTELLTTQLYFDEAYTAEVYTAEPYAEFGPPDTSWADDRLIGDPATDGTGIALQPANTTLGSGTLGLVNLGVRV